MSLTRAGLVGISCAVFAGGGLAAAPAAKEETRLLKSWPAPGAGGAIGGFLREWEACGVFPLPGPAQRETDYLRASGGEAAAKTEGRVLRADGSAAAWTPFTSTGDRVDVAAAFPGQKTDRVAAYLAAARLTNSSEKPLSVYLSVGSSGPAAVYLNSRRVYANAANRYFRTDEDLVPVTLEPGANRLLVRLENERGRWRFALRFLTQGQVEAIGAAALLPTLGELDKNGTLSVASDSGLGKWIPDAAPVWVEAVAPGGKVVEVAAAARSGTAFLHTREWPSGPYEIRCARRAADGKTVYAYLPWYKGDYLDEARELLDECNALAQGALRNGEALDAASARGAHLRVLGELIVDRLEGDPRTEPKAARPAAALSPFAWQDIHSALMEHREWQMGDPAAVRPGGFVRLAWVDPLDDSPQFARVCLPPDYDPKVKWPLVVNLHGSSPSNRPYVGWSFAVKRHDAFADRYGLIMLEPHGRYNSGYVGFGEDDVLRALKMAKEAFNVDDDRVYLMGFSMGGGGTWGIGSRRPELFAALAPSSGTFDYRARPSEGAEELTPMQRYEQERWSSLSQADALLTTPVFINHGDQDPQVDVENARYAARVLQRWGYDVRYAEVPGAGHGGLGTEDAVMQWFLAHKRAAAPRIVRVRAAELKSAAAHWVRVTRSREPATYIHVEAEIVDRHTIRLSTENVAGILLTPGPELVDHQAPVRIVCDGTLLEPQKFSGGAIGFGEPDGPGLCKTPALEGPLRDAWNKPFAIVVGTTSKDPVMKRFVELRAEAERDAWLASQHVAPRCFQDAEITDDQISRYSLLLFGGPEENGVTRKLIEKLPLKLDPEAITVGGRRFEGRDAAVAMIYPHPLNPNRYVVVTAANSPAGMFFADRLSEERDFSIADGRVATGGGRGNGDKVLIASGYFNEQWKLDEKYVETGDPAARGKALVRKAPKYMTAAVDAPVLMLSELLESRAGGGFRRMMRDANWQGAPITLAGKTYASGIGVAAQPQSNTVAYDLSGADGGAQARPGWKRLRATIGLELVRKPAELTENDKKWTRVSFVVLGDGKELYRSPVFDCFTEPRALDVDISAIKTLELCVVNESKMRVAASSVDWAEARLEK